MNRRILFVDDDPNVLSGLRRMLRPLRSEWDMEFVESGPDALSCLERTYFDVVVTDMRMPVMDGAQLLAEIASKHPGIIRIVLSGHSDEEMILRAVGNTHQFLAKPCDTEILKNTISRAFVLREILDSKPLKELISGMDALPVLPAAYKEISDELQSADASVRKIGQVISRDMGLTAKILHLVNSAFFGLPKKVSDPTQAASYLGLDTLKSLFLSTHVFSQFSGKSLDDRKLEDLSRHGLMVGALARMVALSASEDRRLTEEALLSGLLHDVGKLILAVNRSSDYMQVLSLSPLRQAPLWEIEREIFGTTHAEIGAYLLGLWGFSDPVVEAVAFHHLPSACPTQQFAPLTAVHLANGLVYEDFPGMESWTKPQLDVVHLQQVGVHGKIDLWRERWRTMVGGEPS